MVLNEMTATVARVFPSIGNLRYPAVRCSATRGKGRHGRRTPSRYPHGSRFAPLGPAVACRRAGQPNARAGDPPRRSAIFANDLGRTGERPTHPKLLDWLAAELPRRNWTVSAFSSGQALGPAAARRDLAGIHQRPNHPARLAARECVRPAITSTCQQQWPVSNRSRFHRRSVYLFARRNLRYPRVVQPEILLAHEGIHHRAAADFVGHFSVDRAVALSPTRPVRPIIPAAAKRT